MTVIFDKSGFRDATPDDNVPAFDTDDDFDRKNGYRHVPSLSGYYLVPDLPAYVVYERKEQAWPFYVDIWNGDEARSVFVSSEAALMELLLRLKTAYQTEVADRVAGLEKAFARFFHAEHGHPPDLACNLCDPEALEYEKIPSQRKR